MDAIILHSAEHSRHALSEGLLFGKRVYATHASAESFLNALGIECCLLSRLISDGEYCRIRKHLAQAVDTLLQSLDHALHPLIEEMGLPQGTFQAGYGYLAKYQAITYQVIGEALGRMIEQNRPDRILVYPEKFDRFLGRGRTVDSFIQLFNQAQKIVRIDYQKEQQAWVRLPDFQSFLRKGFSLFSATGVKRRFHGILLNLRARVPIPGQPTVFLLEPLYDLEFLKEAFLDGSLPAANLVILKPLVSSSPSASFPATWLNSMQSISKNIDVPLDFLFGDMLKADLIANFLVAGPLAKQVLADAEKKATSYPPAIVVWGAGQVSFPINILIEKMRSSGVPIIGCQHGNIYGDAFEPWHFDCDFDRCDTYISYGFTQHDLKELYPEKTRFPNVIPCGSTRMGVKHRPAQKPRPDILFPLTNSLSLIAEGSGRLLPDRLYHRQLKILEYLGSLTGLDIVIKPFKGANEENCCVFHDFARFQNIKIVSDVSLSEYLHEYEPRIAIVEYPSTPLIEMLPLNTELFMTLDPVMPYTDNALVLLNKRIHSAASVEGTIHQLDSFLKGSLMPKRDNAYWNHYVHRSESKKQIIALIASYLRK